MPEERIYCQVDTDSSKWLPVGSAVPQQLLQPVQRLEKEIGLRLQLAAVVERCHIPLKDRPAVLPDDLRPP